MSPIVYDLMAYQSFRFDDGLLRRLLNVLNFLPLVLGGHVCAVNQNIADGCDLAFSHDVQKSSSPRMDVLPTRVTPRREIRTI